METGLHHTLCSTMMEPMGDQIADDGIYSLEVKAPETVGEAEIVFHAVDTDKNEIDSEAIILTVK